MAKQKANAATETEFDATAAALSIEEIEAALSSEGEINLDDLEIDPADYEEGIEGLEDIEAAQELGAEETEIVAEEIEPEDEPEEIAPVEETKPAKAAKEKKAKEPKEPKEPKAPKQSYEEQVKSMLTGVALDTESEELDADAALALAQSVKQKKVREKVTNLLEAANSGRSLSVYTKIALEDVLIPAYRDGCTAVTTAMFKTAFEKRGYKPGTCSAQSGQMGPLFATLGLVKETGVRTFTPNQNSLLLDTFATQ